MIVSFFKAKSYQNFPQLHLGSFRQRKKPDGKHIFLLYCREAEIIICGGMRMEGSFKLWPNVLLYYVIIRGWEEGFLEEG